MSTPDSPPWPKLAEKEPLACASSAFQLPPSPFRMTDTVPRPAGVTLVRPAAAPKAAPSTSDASRRISTHVPAALRSKRKAGLDGAVEGRRIGDVEGRQSVVDARRRREVGERDRPDRRLRRRETQVEVEPAGEVGVDDAGPGSDRRIERREGGKECPEVERVEGERATATSAACLTAAGRARLGPAHRRARTPRPRSAAALCRR